MVWIRSNWILKKKIHNLTFLVLLFGYFGRSYVQMQTPVICRLIASYTCRKFEWKVRSHRQTRIDTCIDSNKIYRVFLRTSGKQLISIAIRARVRFTHDFMNMMSIMFISNIGVKAWRFYFLQNEWDLYNKLTYFIYTISCCSIILSHLHDLLLNYRGQKRTNERTKSD